MTGRIVERRQKGTRMKGNFTRMLTLQGTSFAAAIGRLRHIAVNDAGSAVLEMAISSTVLFAMFFGVFEAGLASYVSHYVSEAAREGARYAIVRGSLSCTYSPNLSNCGASQTTIANYVKGLSYPGLVPANMTVNVSYMTGTGIVNSTTGLLSTTWASCAGLCNNPGNMVNVAVSYQLPLTVPFVPQRVLTVSSTSQMVVQQ